MSATFTNLIILILLLAASLFVIRLMRGRRFGIAFALLAALCYFAALLYLTLLGRTTYPISGFKYSFPPPFINAIIKANFGKVAIRSMMNLLLFVPFGYIVPCLADMFAKQKPYLNENMKPKIGLIKTTLLGFLLSLSIEVIQMLSQHGVFEIDDLLKNTMGAAIGWYVYYLINFKFGFNNKNKNKH